MDNSFKKLAQEINFKILPGFKNVKIIKQNFEKEKLIYHFDFETPVVIEWKEMHEFIKAINNFKHTVKFQFLVKLLIFDKKTVFEYLKWTLNTVLKKPKLFDYLKNAKCSLEKNVLSVPLDSFSMGISFNKVKPSILKVMNTFGFKDFQLKLLKPAVDETILMKEKEEYFQKVKRTNFNNNGYSKRNFNAPSNNNSFVNIERIHEESFVNKTITTAGKIFSIAEMNNKRGKIFSITNLKEAIDVICFRNSFSSIDEFKEGHYIKVTGMVRENNYYKNPEIYGRTIKRIEPFEKPRIDDAINKRIEFNAKTQMSAMDGVVSVKKLVKTIQKWKHKALAIVDQDSVQGFPDFFHECKARNIKAIYGCSFKTIFKNPEVILNKTSNKKLSEDTYVVLDLETTGLSPIFDEIIEFGAIKVQGGRIVGRSEFFIKPTKEIPKHIINLTGINNEMLKDAISQEEGIKRIKEFIGDDTIVAHNAKFDFGFIEETNRRFKLEKLNNSVIDTLVVAKLIKPEAKKFNLESVAFQFNVAYDEEKAHRAIYDAEALAKVWLKMLYSMQVKNIFDQNALKNMRGDFVYKKTFPNSVVLLAKNQKGLKELFKLSSLSHTKNFFKGPRLFLEDLEKRENLLLGSGGIQSRLVEKMFNGSRSDVEKEIQRYDYIEVQPPHNFKHYLARGMKNEEIEKIISFVIQCAKKHKKLIIATSDSRYIHPYHKIFHKIYVNTKGLGGVRHHLYNFKNPNAPIPDQYLLSTKEMLEAFSFLKDKNLIEEIVIKNPAILAEQFEFIEVISKKLHTPIFKDSEKKLKELAYSNARKIYGNTLPEIVEKRIEKEIEPIIKYGFANIYWISHLLVKKSLEDKYLVGSRGSVGSSLVATLTNITEVNPLVPHYICKKCKFSEFFPKSNLNSGYDLPDKKCPKCNEPLRKEGQKIPFETFLGFSSEKIPDIDLNFSGEYQHKIHQEVRNIFGERHCFRAGTITTVAERTAFGFVKGWIEEKNLKYSKTFIEYLAKGVAGTKRTTGQHPGGIIVIPKNYEVEDFTPINYPANDTSSEWMTTHFDFRAIHDNVLKLDLLGHDDPTAIKMLEELTGVEAKKIPVNDERVISIFSSPKELGVAPKDINGEETGALGIPEFGTKFVRGMLKSAKVKSFGDLISISGLSHGTNVWANNAENLIKNKGLTLNEVISCRDDIMLDLIAKNVEDSTAFNIMEKIRKGYGITKEEISLLKEHNVPTWYINSLKEIKYMFPKAHATAYVMMAWRIAWFKVYYPLEYYAVYFSTRADQGLDIQTLAKGKNEVEKLLKDLLQKKSKKNSGITNKEILMIPDLELANEMYARGYKIKNINLKKSDAFKWVIDDDKSLIPPFIFIDGFGSAVAKSIVEARKKSPFSSINDLEKRTILNKTNLEKLEKMGVLKDLFKTDQIEFNF